MSEAEEDLLMDEKREQSVFVRVEGMFCGHCLETVSAALKKLPGVSSVDISRNVAEIRSAEELEKDDIIRVIREAGYETDEDKIGRKRRQVLQKVKWYEILLIAGVIILLAFVINRIFGYNVFNAIPAVDSTASYGMLFLTGLLTSIHCVGMCGAIGIYASSEDSSVRSLSRPVLYNSGRVISYTLTGGVVGLVGSVLSVSAAVRGAIIIAAGLFMFVMALSMMGLIDLRLPRFLNTGGIRRRSGALVLGLLNGFMPCGPLQAMQLYALSTGSFLSGAFAMLLFALGTVPLMFAYGALINLTRGKARALIGKIASVLILILALSMLYRGLLGLGVDVASVIPQEYGDYTASVIEDGVQTVSLELDFDSFGDVIVQKGIPVRMVIHADEGKITGCNNEVVSADLDFDVRIRPGDNVIEFTPREEGEYTYTCWMNMIRTRIRVIDDIDYFGTGG